MFSSWSPLAFFVAFAFVSSAVMGGQLVLVAWVANEARSVALVGQLFFVASLSTLLFSVIAGVHADRRSRREVIRAGQIFQFAAGCVLLLGIAEPSKLIGSLFAFAILIGFGFAASAGAVDGAQQSLIPRRARVSTAIRIAILRQLGMAAGMGVSGLVLHDGGATACAAFLLLLAVVPIYFAEQFSRRLPAPAEPRATFLASWGEGLSYAARQPALAAAMIAVALTYSVSQMTNVLVPDFTREVLGAGSDVYGALEASWSIGGGAILVSAMWRERFQARGRTEFGLIAFVGAAMIAFSAARSVNSAIAIYAFMGALCSLARALSEGRILALADPARIGRVRAATTILASACGLAIYALPTFLSVDALFYFRVWGVALLGAGLGLACMARRTAASATPIGRDAGDLLACDREARPRSAVEEPAARGSYSIGLVRDGVDDAREGLPRMRAIPRRMEMDEHARP